jgi:hypothetical protein
MPTKPAADPRFGTLVEQMALNGQKNPALRAEVEGSSDGVVAIGLVYPARLERFTFRRYVKTQATFATKMLGAFRVQTPEGLHEGKPGDYLAIGVHGEMYPIDADVMEESYEEQAPGLFRVPVEPLEGTDRITEQPLKMKVEPDGAISEVSGGPLDHVVETGPTTPQPREQEISA